MEYTCDICEKVLYRYDNFNTHAKKHDYGHDCNICHKPFEREIDLINHYKCVHTSQIGGGEIEDPEFYPKFIVEKVNSRVNSKFATNQHTYSARL